MRRNTLGYHTHLLAEHLQQWLRESYLEETSNVHPNTTQWIKLVEIIKFMWETGSIPTELVWTVLVLISKVDVDTRGIGLLEVF